jgi:hypothetical protein
VKRSRSDLLEARLSGVDRTHECLTAFLCQCCEQQHLSYRCRPRITMFMLPSRALIALASPSFSLADLRSQTPMIIVGVILLAVGTAAVTLFFFRRKSRDFALIYFSIFSILYAVRLLLRMRVVRSLAGVSDSLVDHINLWITFTLLIPFLLFLRQVLGPQIKTLVNRLLIALGALAVVAITADLFGVRGSFAVSLNSYLVLVIVGGLTAKLIVLRSRGLGQPWTGEYRVLTIGLAVFGAFVLHGNLADLGLWRGGPDDEALGFLFFVGCLGYVAAHRTFANEHRLVALTKSSKLRARSNPRFSLAECPASLAWRSPLAISR